MSKGKVIAKLLEFEDSIFVLTFAALGFWAPWIQLWGVSTRMPLMEWLVLELNRTAFPSFAAPIVIVASGLVAAAGAILRLLGTAYLGSETVKHQEMLAGQVMADGPYRYVRNPLYLGLWFVVAAMSFLMPAPGAPVAIVLISIFLYRLILGEEAFLESHLGEAYQTYLRAVPRLIPRLRPTFPAAGCKPRWAQALVYELYPIGVFLILAVLSWSHDTLLMERALLVAFGIGLMGRILLRSTARGEVSKK